MRREKISLTCSPIPRCRLGAAFSPAALLLALAPPSPLAGSTRQQQMTGASPSETAATMPKASRQPRKSPVNRPLNYGQNAAKCAPECR